jgi:hypothetical protein
MRKRFERRRVQAWQTVGGACSFVVGILAALIGSLIAVSGWVIGADQHPGLRATGTILLVLAILLIIFAGFCLDWAEQDQNESLVIRKENPEQHSVPEETIERKPIDSWQQKSSVSSSVAHFELNKQHTSALPRKQR